MDYIDRALKVAERSSLKKHKTGAVITNAYGEEIAIGWSHHSKIILKETWTVHAELHAIYRAFKPSLLGGRIYIATFSAKSGNPCMSRPCNVCLPYLSDIGLETAIYTTSANGELITERIEL